MCLPSEANQAYQQAQRLQIKGDKAIAQFMTDELDVRAVIVRSSVLDGWAVEVFPHSAPYFTIPQCTDETYALARGLVS